MTRALAVEFGAITADNVEQLRKVNTVSFPVTYNEGFYQDVVKRKSESLNKFAYYNGFVVGAVCTRIEPIAKEHSENSNTDNKQQDPAATTKHRLYIMTLAVLAAYRGRGIGTQLIQSIIDMCEQLNRGELVDDTLKKDGLPPRIDEIALHVQISNEDAIDFYTGKLGFVKGDMVENYYRRIDPPHCYRLYKTL